MSTNRFVQLSRLVTLAALAGPLAGCATKGDLRNVTNEIRALSARQDSLLVALQRQALVTQDSLRGTTNQLIETRGSVNQQMTRLQNDVGIVRQENAQIARQLSAIRDQLEALASRVNAAPAVASDVPGGGGGQVVELYNVALDRFNARQFGTARSAFEQLVNQYPNHDLAPEAQYKLAEIHLEQGRTADALQKFETIPQLYPSAPKVPDALYRIAEIHLSQNPPRRNEARTILRRIIESYPNSAILPMAQQKLREIGPGQ